MKTFNLPQTKLILVLLFVMMLSSDPVRAQPEFDEDVQDTPVDGGVGLLLAAGVGYGIRKIRKSESTKA